MNEDPSEKRVDRRKGYGRNKVVITDTVKKVLIDTNIFMLHGPRAVFQHTKHDVVIKPEVRAELNHSKKEKRKIGENSRNTNAFFTSALEGRSIDEIKNGIPLSSLTHLVFGKSVRINVTGLLFIETEECENDSVFFTDEFKFADVISVTIKFKNGEEKVIPVSKDVGFKIKKAFRDMNDRAILLGARKLKKAGESVLLISNDIKFRADAHLEGIDVRDYIEEIEVTRKNAKNRPGRCTSQRQAGWN